VEEEGDLGGEGAEGEQHPAVPPTARPGHNASGRGGGASEGEGGGGEGRSQCPRGGGRQERGGVGRSGAGGEGRGVGPAEGGGQQELLQHRRAHDQRRAVAVGVGAVGRTKRFCVALKRPTAHSATRRQERTGRCIPVWEDSSICWEAIFVIPMDGHLSVLCGSRLAPQSASCGAIPATNTHWRGGVVVGGENRVGGVGSG